MKKVLINTRTLAIALAATFMTSLSSSALANDEKKPIPVELKFIGNTENQPVFLLAFSNAEENEFTIIIRDEFDYVLYKENVKGENITKKFRLNTEELGDGTILFEISGKKTDETVIFEVKNTLRFIEDVVINKID